MRSVKNLENWIPLSDKNHEWPQIYVICIVSLTGFTASAFYTWPSPSIPLLISNSSHIDNITLDQASYFSVIPPIAAIVTSPIAALLMDTFGRKKMILFLAIPHILGWILIAIAKNVFMLYISRVLSGIGDAIFFCVIPAYIGEVANPQVRGSWGNLMSILIYFGQFLINIVGAYCDVATTALIFLSLPVIQIVFIAFIPESPYYLLMKNNKMEAEQSLKYLRWNQNVSEELSYLTKDVDRQVSESGSLKDLFVIDVNRKALLIALTMRACQQFSGLPAFAVYTQYIFGIAGGSMSASTSAIIYTGVLFITSSMCGFVAGRFSRRLLLTVSSVGCAFALLIETIYFFFSKELGVEVVQLSWVPVTGLVFYIIFCSVGLGILPNLMLGELFSASIKSKAMWVINISFSFNILLVSKVFHLLTKYFGMYVPFLFFFLCSLASSVFSYWCIPETKGKTLEQVQQLLIKKSRISDEQIPQ